MGRGNVCTKGPYEGLFYIDNDYIQVFRYDNSEDSDDEPETRLAADLTLADFNSCKWYYDEEGTALEQEDIEHCIVESFSRRFPAFESELDRIPEKWLRDGAYGYYERRVIAESKLFYLCIQDNEWSVAVELIQRKDPYDDYYLVGLQKKNYQTYLKGLMEVMLDRLPSIGTYAGIWTSGRLTREDLKNDK